MKSAVEGISNGHAMSNWPSDELAKIAETDDLHIAPFREDGKTYGTLTWIWSVAVDGDLYARRDRQGPAPRRRARGFRTLTRREPCRT